SRWKSGFAWSRPSRPATPDPVARHRRRIVRGQRNLCHKRPALATIKVMAGRRSISSQAARGRVVLTAAILFGFGGACASGGSGATTGSGGSGEPASGGTGGSARGGATGSGGISTGTGGTGTGTGGIVATGGASGRGGA